jgi:DNA invertase Pin-like site-specific DNA recombinase/phosphatidylethanolamine-binding protein (PEBP) family uncharacterized protein
MLNRIERGDVEQVLAESTDRVARHIGDAHAVREHLEHFGARLFTLADGHVDEITGTIKGLMDARFLKDLAERVRRGQRGQHSRGFNAGGRAYGYRVLKPIGEDGEIIRGILEVNEDEAAIIRRIYDETNAGVPARVIVRALNDEGVPAPRGKRWNVSVIHGGRERANGILRNNLYRGIMIYGRFRKTFHPKTRKRILRPNPMSEWRYVEVPKLRIVSDQQWALVEARYAAFDGTVRRQVRRPKRLLSTLGRCGVCGGMWTVVGPERWGCSIRKGQGDCSNTRTISTRLYEQGVLGQLKGILLDPEAVALFVDRYNAGIRARQAEANANRAPLERKAADLRAKATRLIDAIADGAGEFQEIKDRLRAAQAELRDVERQLVAFSGSTPIELSHDLGHRYRAYIAELDTALASEGVARERAANAIRGMIDKITLTPKSEGKGVDIHVTGHMAEIINLAKQS